MERTKRFLPNLRGKVGFKRLCAVIAMVCLLAVAGSIITYAAEDSQTTDDSKKLLNGSFEEGQEWSDSYKQPHQDDVPAWHTTAFQNKMELFRTNTGIYIKPSVVLEPTDGLYAAELNADEESTLYQNVSTTPFSVYEWGLDHGARNGTDIMALVIGPKQSVNPSKPNKQGRDQFMQMVDWLNIDNESVAPGATPLRYTVYSKKFAAEGTFEDNAGNNAFSLTPSTIYTERWEIWIMSSSNKSIDENNKLIWNSYGSNAESNAESGSESNDIDLNKYYLYTVPADQTETVFGFVSVGYLESTASADKAKTYGNFLDNIHFQIYHPLSGSTTNHGSAIVVGSDGSTEGEGEIIGHEITVDDALQTYVTDGLPLKVQAIIRAEDKADCEFSGFFYTKQNEDGTPTTVFIPKIDSQNVIEDTGSLTGEEKAGKWIKSTNENGDIVYTYEIDAITSATDLHFVFFKSPGVTYDPNGGKPYIVGEQLNDEEDANAYNFTPINNEGEGAQYIFCPPYVSHAAEGQNDGWKFMGWKVTGDYIDIPDGADIATTNADKLGDLIIPAVHTVACDYSFDNASSLNTAQYFKFLDGDVQLTENIQYSSDNVSIDGVLWEDQGEELLYANMHKGMTLVAQWRWLQAFIPQSSNDIQLGFDDSDRGGHVEIAVEDTDENYNGLYTENGGKSYHAATNEWVTVTAIPNTGYEFVGWYTENENGEMVLVTTNPTYKYLETKESVKTYYARFYGRIRQEYIRQVWNGSTWEDISDDAIGVLDRYEYVDAPEKPISSTATADKNYMFVGWYDAQGNAVGEDMLANEGKTISYITKEDATYYARFVRLPTLGADVAVIDYGLPVDIHVLANDTSFAPGTITLAGICRDIPTDMSPTETMMDGFVNSFDGTYGSARVNDDGTITYSKSGMMMDQPETFAYAIMYQRDENTRYCYSTVTVVPATTLYYEDSFVTLDGSWEAAGESQSAHQAEDRPGGFEFPDYDADNVYGYDGAYDTCTTYSLGSAMKVKVSTGTYAQNGSWPTAKFTFSGTGFDLISLTSNQTGFITCRVYEGTTTDTLYKSWVVDTYYGYTRSIDTEYPWVKYTWTYSGEHWSAVKECVAEKDDDETAELPTNPQDGDVYVQYKENYVWTPATGSDNSLYQIPVIKSPELPYGTYTVVVTPTYIPFFDHTGAGSYDFYLDAVRVYNPAQNMDDYYVLDGEGWPQYIELRKELLSKDDSDNAIAYVNGVSFIDGVSDGTVSDYENYGPNNEIYLNSRQAVAFAIESNGASIASVQVGIKTFDQTGTLTASCVDAESNTLATGDLQIGTHTDMYYSLTNLNGASCLQWQDSGTVSQAIVLTNTGDTPITLTTLKITYQSQPGTEAELCMNLALMQAASESVTQKLASLHSRCYHRFSYAVDTVPTEAEAGVLTGTCVDCGEAVTLAMPVLFDSRYTSAVTKEPTCTDAGVRTYTDAEYNVSFDVVLPALGHELVTDAAVAATCTQSGLTEGCHCTRCDYRVEQAVTEPTEHNYTNYTVETVPTETETGVLTGTCADCGQSVTLAMPVLTNSRYTSAVTKEPTCTDAGVRTYTDAEYNVSFDVVLPALGHELVTDAAVAATCTQSGLTEGCHCTRCDYRVEQAVIELAEHNYTNYTVETVPTETETGVLTGTCADCGQTVTLAMPVLSDSRYASVVTKEPTCTEAGVLTYTDEEYNVSFDAELSVLGHALVTDAAVAATCTQSGLTEGCHCTRCDYRVEQAVIEAAGHSYADGLCVLCGEKQPQEAQEDKQQEEPENGREEEELPAVCPSESFTDAPAEGHWAHEGIDFVIGQGLMNGVGNGLFAPDGTMNRAMLVTVLWHLDGKPDASSEAGFADVPSGTWYTAAVAWAREAEIVYGVGGNCFDPMGEITREQTVVILYRYARSKQMAAQSGDLSRFADGSEVSAWAEEAVSWAEAAGILRGADENGRLLLQPKNAITRAEAAAMLTRYCKAMEEAE